MERNNKILEPILPIDFEEQKYRNKLWKPVVAYLVFGFMWIIFSDKLMAILVTNKETYMTLQIYKGWFFILVTSVLLYVLIKGDYYKMINLTKSVTIKNQELVSFSEELLAMDDELQKKILDLNITLQERDNQKSFVDVIYNHSDSVIVVFNEQGEMIDVNKAFEEKFQFEFSNRTNIQWREHIICETDRAKVFPIKDLFKDSNRVMNLELGITTGKGEHLDTVWNVVSVSNPIDNTPMIVAFGKDVTIVKVNERKIYNLAYYDTLTRLKNKVLFDKETREIIAEGIKFSVFYIDFDDFKNLNDVHGHDVGDQFLSQFAIALETIAHKDNIYRIAGDEFFVIDFSESLLDDELKIKCIMALTNKQWHVSGIEYFPSVSIGVTRLPYDTTEITEVYKNLDIAMSSAKESGKGTYRFFREEYRTQAQKLINLEGKINRALKSNEFSLNYQPVVDFMDQSVKGVEVLIRWENEKYNISTGEFIGIAEKTGQIVKIDKWVITNAFKMIKQKISDYHVIVSINISAKTLSSLSILEFLEGEIKTFSIDPSFIEFEITEHSLITDLEKTKQLIDQIKTLGFRIALDDFGTQYSSLNYLCSIPFNTLKIDKSYIDEINSEKKRHIIVHKIIQMAKELGLSIVGEGVEDQEQYNTLKKLGCDYCQGYLIAWPLDEAGIVKFIEESGGSNEKRIKYSRS